MCLDGLKSRKMRKVCENQLLVRCAMCLISLWNSCWTFSTVAALESAHAIKTGMMVLLSEQQACSRSILPTCSFRYDALYMTCDRNAFAFVHANNRG